MDIHSLYQLFLPHFRARRFRRFFELMKPRPETVLLDVGGYPWVWAGRGFPGPVIQSNLAFPDAIRTDFPKDLLVLADGLKLPFEDRSVDIGFSNSVIEHLHSFENQRLFAAEIRRVARSLWVQTPARWFWVEPHLMTPFIHFLPKAMQRRMLRHFSVWGLVRKPTPKEVDAFLNEVRLLTFDDMKVLFPDCEILKERVLGFTKSFIAVRLDAPRSCGTYR